MTHKGNNNNKWKYFNYEVNLTDDSPLLALSAGLITSLWQEFLLGKLIVLIFYYHFHFIPLLLFTVNVKCVHLIQNRNIICLTISSLTQLPLMVLISIAYEILIYYYFQLNVCT